MRVGTSVLLLAVGAILVWAVNAEVPNVSLDVIGYILMAAGVLGLIWSLVAANRNRVTQTRTVQNPATGEQVQRSESRDTL